MANLGKTSWLESLSEQNKASLERLKRLNITITTSEPTKIITEMREQLRLLNEPLGAEVSDDTLLFSEPEIRRLMDQDRACKECRGFESCEYDGMIGKLDLWENSLRYVVSHRCSVRTNFFEMKKTEDILKKMRLPATVARMNFANFKADTPKLKELSKLAKDIVSGQLYIGLFLAGEPGLGKTHLGSAMLQEWTKKGKAGIYVTTTDLFKKLRAFEKGNPDELLDLVSTVPFLFLDDLGVEKPSDFVRQELFHIINHRHNNARTAANPKGLVTVITSNYIPSKLIERLDGESETKTGQAIVSRIVGMCKPVIVEGQDRRIRG